MDIKYFTGGKHRLIEDVFIWFSISVEMIFKFKLIFSKIEWNWVNKQRFGVGIGAAHIDQDISLETRVASLKSKV